MNKGISTHTPHARRDIWGYGENYQQIEFQLTRLMRGVTTAETVNEKIEKNFNSHASCEA